ncbi:T9SS type A sorting domain-containing protein [Hanstruepera ponticola]|uniref:T9SS type A sorting domain-containing protein n=1 Tax=Hanstruepera ponticola TaxID=2042995 RepID=UPI000CF0FA30|nr:T9SS type A sorting domain-containing protein [Hanstruepera ponticola]
MKSKLQNRNPKFHVILTSLLTFVFAIFISQSNVLAQNQNSRVDGGVISTNDNTSICIDSEADPINVTVEGDSGRLRQWIITDDNNNILALPDAPPFDLNGAGPGVCRIWHLAYNGIPPFRRISNLDDLRGRFDLSNYIEVTRTMLPEGGELAIAGSGDTEIEICAGDGESDAFDVTLDGAMGDNSLWVITDANLNILGTPPSPPFDLEGAGEGVCLIWHLSYADSVDLTGVTNAADLMGCYDLSNPITVTRNGVNGGELAIAGSGDTEIEICAGDGESDAFDVTLEDAMGDNSLWVITDANLNILGTPPSPPFDLEGAGEGVCLIWHLSYSDSVDLTGVTNAADLMGCYDLSNPITVTRNGVNGGELAIAGSGDTEIEICAGDGESDAFDVTLEDAMGENSLWVITDANLNILGTPPSPPFDLEGAGEGVCLIWHLSYSDSVDLTGVTNAADLMGCYDLSNPITVTRNGVNGGELAIAGSGDTEIEICAGDGESDAFDVTLDGAMGDNSLWVITDANLNILGTPPSPPFDLEGAGEGVCLIWHLSYSDSVDLTGVTNAADLMGCYDLSNPITVTRNGVNGGELAIAGSGETEIDIIAGDGQSDAFDVTLDGAMGDNALWVITDTDLNILGTPPSPPFDLEGAGEGVCLIWHLSYADSVDLTGITNAGDLMGCYALSNPITVTRTEALNRFNLFPNPATTNTTLQLPETGLNTYDILVYDLYNTEVIKKRIKTSVTKTTVELNLNSLNVGPYIVVIVNQSTGERTVKKLLKKN